MGEMVSLPTPHTLGLEPKNPKPINQTPYTPKPSDI